MFKLFWIQLSLIRMAMGKPPDCASMLEFVSKHEIGMGGFLWCSPRCGREAVGTEERSEQFGEIVIEVG